MARLAPSLLLLALLLAGCAGTTTPTDTQSSTTTGAPAVPMAWKATAKDGDIRAIPALYPQGVVGTPERFTVAKGGSSLWLNITLSGPVPSDAIVRYIEPGCDAADCRHNVQTSGGAAQLQLDNPPAGEWEMGFFANPAVPFSGTYHLEINLLAPAT